MITKVTKSIIYYIETNEEEYSDYIRHGSDNWDNRMGESYEPVYNCDGLEKEFQEYIKVKGCIDDSVAFSEVVSGFDTTKLIQDYERKVIAINALLDNYDRTDESYRLKGKREAYRQIIQDIKSRCQNV